MKKRELEALLRESTFRHGFTWTRAELVQLCIALEEVKEFKQLGIARTRLSKEELADAVLGFIKSHPGKAAPAFRTVQLQWLLTRKKQSQVLRVGEEEVKYVEKMIKGADGYDMTLSPYSATEPHFFEVPSKLPGEKSVVVVKREEREVKLFENDKLDLGQIEKLAPEEADISDIAATSFKVVATSVIELDVLRKYSWNPKERLLRVEVDRGLTPGVSADLAMHLTLKIDLVDHAGVTDESEADRVALKISNSHALNKGQLAALLDNPFCLVTQLDIRADKAAAGYERLQASKDDVSLTTLLKAKFTEQGNDPVDPSLIKGSDVRFDVRQNHTGLKAAQAAYAKGKVSADILRARGKYFAWEDIANVHSLATLTLLIDFVDGTVTVEGHSNPAWLYEDFVRTLMGLV